MEEFAGVPKGTFCALASTGLAESEILGVYFRAEIEVLAFNFEPPIAGISYAGLLALFEEDGISFVAPVGWAFAWVVPLLSVCVGGFELCEQLFVLALVVFQFGGRFHE